MLLKHSVHMFQRTSMGGKMGWEKRNSCPTALQQFSERAGSRPDITCLLISVLIYNPHCFFEVFWGYIFFQQANWLFRVYLCWVLVLKVISLYYWAVLALWSPWHWVADHMELQRNLGLICTAFAPWCFSSQDLIPGWVLVFSWLLRLVSWGFNTNIYRWNLLKYLKEAKNKCNWRHTHTPQKKIVLEVKQ